MKKRTFHTMLLSLLFAACTTSPKSDNSLHIADIRSLMSAPTTVPLANEIESVSYVPLQLTTDDGSIIDGVMHYTVTDKAIYIYPTRERKIVEFDRKGNFVRELISGGQGPNELSCDITSMQADAQAERLYLHSMDRTMVYDLDGKLIEAFTPAYQNIYKRQIGPDRIAAIAFPYVPFEQGSYGIGVFSNNGDTIALKNDFSASAVSKENCGLTVGMAADYSNNPNGLLFKQGSNDTVFILAEQAIAPVCILTLQNSDDEIKRSLDATDMSSIRNLGDDKDIVVSDLFETPASYYFRMRYNGGHYVAALDKKTGQSSIEKCVQPGSLQELAGVNMQYGMLGSRSFENFPIWGRTEGCELVQIVMPYEIDLYNKTGEITVPEALASIESNDNPIFVFYKLKQ
ncbi:MAG: 6-bladed beta-propeller [Tannerellaceae bacterium]